MEDILISFFLIKKEEKETNKVKVFAAVRKSNVGSLVMIKLTALSNSIEKTIELLNKKILEESIIKFNNGYITESNIFDDVKYELEHYQIMEIEV